MTKKLEQAVFCSECGAEVVRKRYAILTRKNFFCSQTCRGLHLKKYRTPQERDAAKYARYLARMADPKYRAAMKKAQREGYLRRRTTAHFKAVRSRAFKRWYYKKRETDPGFFDKRKETLKEYRARKKKEKSLCS